MYSYGPYGLYRASVPVQGCTLPLPFLCYVNGAVRGRDTVLYASCSWSRFSFKLERYDRDTVIL
jgi:hypothetical protein